MYLKRIEMVGFKTFSQKTEIEFPRGFVAVVGPNGSGKSNLTDAIRFCLGEQSPKAMRAAKLEELVFAGAPGKKGAPFAEVTITFDNSDQTLPLDMAEVSIARRLDADGDSKFYINRVSCRLRDVHELLMGSGVGPGSFSVLGGKEVDMVLSTDPKDRRAMLEETAGVNRYKFRKREAQRKLEKTAANLMRLRDILRELEVQLEESKKQLARYEKYKLAQVELKELETELSLHEWVRLNQKRDAAEQKLGRCGELLIEAEAAYAALREQMSDLLNRKKAFDEEREVQNQKLSQLREQLAVARANFDSVSQRSVQLEVTAQSAQHRWESNQARLQDQQLELETMLGRLPEQKQQTEEAKVLFEDARKEMEQLPSATQGPHGELRVKMAALEKENNQLVTRRETLKARKETDMMRQLELEEQAANCRAELARFTPKEVAQGDLGGRLEEAQRLTAQQQAIKEQIERDLDKVRADRRTLEQQRRPLVSQLAELEAILEDRSGLPPAVRAVMSWREPGTVGLVGELIQVPPGLEVAYEAALGGHVNDIITRDRRVASRLIDRLKQERAGRVTFWPLDLERMPPPPLQLPDRKGVIGGALELLGYPKEIETVLSEMLGRTAIMEDLPSGLALYDRCRGRRPHLVTKQGEYLNPSGALTGGSLRQNQNGMMNRRRLLDEAKIKLQSQEKNLLKFTAEEDRLHVERAKADQALQAAREVMRLLKQESADDAADTRRRQADLDRATKGLKKAEEEMDALMNREVAAIQELKKIEERLLEIEEEKEETEEELSRFQEEEMRLRAQRDIIQRRLIDVQVDYERKRQMMQETEREIARSETRKKELEADGVLAQEEKIRAEDARVLLKLEGEGLQLQIAEFERLFADGAEAMEEVRRRAADTDAEYALAQKDLDGAENRVRTANNNLNKAQVEAATVEAHVEEALARLGGVPEEADLPTEPKPVEELEKLRAKTNRLRNFLENFGSVNLGAQEDHERLLARYDELYQQVSDLDEGAASLKLIMDEMDAITVVQFKDAYDRVNETFGKMFTDLFQGGTARLELVVPGDMLDSGVEIVACPPGKKLQNLSLLSSGERALSAMAFLLALLTCKPSPMVILDELDAPLDDANVERVANRLLQFSDQSQFLVITHNRKTMEFADHLYGVTMEEPGVSRILSVRLTKDGEMVPQAAPKVEEPAVVPA